jgi:hypothetical protein
MADPVAQLLQSALAGFRCIEDSATPLLTAAHALRDLLRASTAVDDLPTRYPQLTPDLTSAIEAATTRVAEAAQAFIPQERTWLLMASGAAGLTGSPLAELAADRRLYVALLIVELEAVMCRQAIAEHGDPLARMISVNRALSAPAPSTSFH